MSTETEQKMASEIIIVTDHKVACDGGGGVLGHPLTWYEMGDDDFVTCKYCDKVFVLKDGKKDPATQA